MLMLVVVRVNVVIVVVVVVTITVTVYLSFMEKSCVLTIFSCFVFFIMVPRNGPKNGLKRQAFQRVHARCRMAYILDNIIVGKLFIPAWEGIWKAVYLKVHISVKT